MMADLLRFSCLVLAIVDGLLGAARIWGAHTQKQLVIHYRRIVGCFPTHNHNVLHEHKSMKNFRARNVKPNPKTHNPFLCPISVSKRPNSGAAIRQRSRAARPPSWRRIGRGFGADDRGFCGNRCGGSPFEIYTSMEKNLKNGRPVLGCQHQLLAAPSSACYGGVREMLNLVVGR